MPTSRPIALTPVCTYILHRKPKSVLDIGIGFGKWGYLAREYTDVWHQRIHKNKWETIIHGIEGFPDYITPAIEYIYDEIFIGNATRVIISLGHYDMILCIAMLEHLTKQEGVLFLNECKEHADLSIFIVPIDPALRGPKGGNIYQAHKSKWKEDELKRFGKVKNLGKQWLLEMQGV